MRTVMMALLGATLMQIGIFIGRAFERAGHVCPTPHVIVFDAGQLPNGELFDQHGHVCLCTNYLPDGGL